MYKLERGFNKRLRGSRLYIHRWDLEVMVLSFTFLKAGHESIVVQPNVEG